MSARAPEPSAARCSTEWKACLLASWHSKLSKVDSIVLKKLGHNNKGPNWVAVSESDYHNRDFIKE